MNIKPMMLGTMNSSKQNNNDMDQVKNDDMESGREDIRIKLDENCAQIEDSQW